MHLLPQYTFNYIDIYRYYNYIYYNYIYRLVQISRESMLDMSFLNYGHEHIG